MKKRYLYAVLWGVPGLFIAAIGTTILVGMLLGVLWLYVFGDAAWPSSVDSTVSILGICIFLGFWLGLTLLGYRLGKRMESEPGMNWKHVLLSAGVTLCCLLYIFIQQLGVGNLGPRSESLICSDFCVQRGYAGSGIPPANSGERTCICYDDSGNEAIKLPLETIEAEIRK